MPEGKRGGYKISAWALEHGARRGGIGMGIGMRVRGGGEGGTESRSVAACKGRGEEKRVRGGRLARRYEYGDTGGYLAPSPHPRP